ncbi:HlyD family efflux transporter periplasmic adaptor subunit [Fulvivirga kasyanovii]|uniref:HlyD family efflux transporter periplasmic adaptor subunit n=2 Tax=Fulvivirga kasyanovii TaxID=396812 RepID=A0ABW9RJE2_9BACT|nr:HlyD family efflux transporter periplasmic adaptor subunit [Fulvivirga kasyanovii]
MPNAEEQIQLRSEEVQEILSHVPHWLIRWGITLVFMVILILIAASWFIKYPDTVAAQVVLTTQTPPVHLVARANGRISLLVEDKQRVGEDALLGVIENPASTEDVLKLDKQLENIRELIYKRPIDIEAIKLDQSLNLGTLQSTYSSFSSIVEDAKRYIAISFYHNQRKELSKRVEYYRALNKGLNDQLSLVDEEIKISRTIYQDDSLLYKQGAGTKPVMNRSKASYLQNQRNKENIESSIIQNSIQIAQLQGQINELTLKEEQETDQMFTTMVETLERLESDLMAWKQNYLLITPVEGKVAFSKFWSDNQYVQAGEEVMTVVPESEDVIGNVAMPVQGSGKVEVGQKVNIMLNNYPSNEYGMVIGKVESISLVPRDNLYSIRISLPGGLNSTYNKQLDFKQEMQGTAEIITKDKRLIERVFNQLRNIIDRVN